MSANEDCAEAAWTELSKAIAEKETNLAFLKVSITAQKAQNEITRNEIKQIEKDIDDMKERIREHKKRAAEATDDRNIFAEHNKLVNETILRLRDEIEAKNRKLEETRLLFNQDYNAKLKEFHDIKDYFASKLPFYEESKALELKNNELIREIERETAEHEHWKKQQSDAKQRLLERKAQKEAERAERQARIDTNRKLKAELEALHKEKSHLLELLTQRAFDDDDAQLEAIQKAPEANFIATKDVQNAPPNDEVLFAVPKPPPPEAEKTKSSNFDVIQQVILQQKTVFEQPKKNLVESQEMQIEDSSDAQYMADVFDQFDGGNNEEQNEFGIISQSQGFINDTFDFDAMSPAKVSSNDDDEWQFGKFF